MGKNSTFLSLVHSQPFGILIAEIMNIHSFKLVAEVIPLNLCKKNLKSKKLTQTIAILPKFSSNDTVVLIK